MRLRCTVFFLCLVLIQERMASAQTYYASAQIGSGNSVRLSCSSGVIVTQYAVYAEHSDGTGCHTEVTGTLRAKCDCLSVCSMQPDIHFNDPCSSNRNSMWLYVKYGCDSNPEPSVCATN